MTNWRRLLLTLPLYCAALSLASATGARQHLKVDTLLDGVELVQAVPMTAFTPTADALEPAHHLQGLLEISLPPGASGFRTLRDDTGYAADPSAKVQQLPAFSFSYIQAGDQLIPATRGVVATDHPHWEWLLEPGRAWQEPGDRGYSRASLPFSLVQRGENCTHNGVMSFLFKDDGAISNVAFQIASETCLYFKFDFWGLAHARYRPGLLPAGPALVQAHTQQLARRLPVRPIEELAVTYAGADAHQFSGDGVIDPADMTVYGFVIDGVNYVGGCQTRLGPYPFCEVLDLPSYSLAKSLLAGLGLMRLEMLYPGIAQARVTDYVPQCAASGNWQGTTFEQTLDMVTGNFTSAAYNVDEASGEMEQGFFAPQTHAAKIAFACAHYPRRTAPGHTWAYHTSDTYVLGTAMTSYLAIRVGPGTDLLEDVLLPWWQPLHLSPTSRVSRRSYDQQAQLFTGYGLFLQADDIAKLAAFANGELIRDQLDTTLLDAALQRNAEDPGAQAGGGLYTYNNGFWAYPDYQSASCENTLNLPFMLGYGGINVVLMPNQTIYYYFSDGGTFGWLAAARESDRIKPYCTPKEEQTLEG